MPTWTSSLCPTCGTPNPPHSLFCDKCGARLTVSLTEDSEESEAATPAVVLPKGLSLPTKPASTPEPADAVPPAESEDEELPDWLQVVQASRATAEQNRAESAAPPQSTSDTEEIPAWLMRMNTEGEPPAEEQKPTTDELLPEWTQRLRTLPETDQPVAEEDEVPDWLKVLGTTGRLPSDVPPASGAVEPPLPEEKPAWLSDTPAPAETPITPAEELPEWLKEHPQFEEPAVAELPPFAVLSARPNLAPTRCQTGCAICARRPLPPMILCPIGWMNWEWKKKNLPQSRGPYRRVTARLIG